MMSVVPGLRRLVVGTSGSPGSLPALRCAQDLARRSGVPPLAAPAWVPPAPGLAGGLSPPAAPPRAGGGRPPPDLDIRPVVIRGEPGPALVEIANSDADLLVVGAGRRGALTR